jgi:hypothetical protein
MTTPSILNTIR